MACPVLCWDAGGATVRPDHHNNGPTTTRSANNTTRHTQQGAGRDAQAARKAAASKPAPTLGCMSLSGDGGKEPPRGLGVAAIEWVGVSSSLYKPAQNNANISYPATCSQPHNTTGTRMRAVSAPARVAGAQHTAGVCQGGVVWLHCLTLML